MKLGTITKKTLILAIGLYSYNAFAQSGVSINTSKTPPDQSAILDISSASQGLLVPRIPFLTGKNDGTTIPMPAHSLFIYTNLQGQDITQEGFYYNIGYPNAPEWVRLTTVAPGPVAQNAWLLEGNGGTNAGVNFIGTTDNQEIIFRQNNEKIGAIYRGGALGFTGNIETGVTPFPLKGAGTKLIYIPAKGGAFRVGALDEFNPDAWDNVNIGISSFAANNNTKASAYGTAAFGVNTQAIATAAASFGNNTKATGLSSFVTGYFAQATGNYAVAMGNKAIASGLNSLATGAKTVASGSYATALGDSTKAQGFASTAIGYGATALTDYAVALGQRTLVDGLGGMATGFESSAAGDYSTAMGWSSDAAGQYATAIGYQPSASGDYSLAMGMSTWASKNAATAMGRQTKAQNDNATAMGYMTTASGLNATAMGNNTTASVLNATAMGSGTTASGVSSTAMGEGTYATGINSTAMGNATSAGGESAVAMGYNNTASGKFSIAMGQGTKALVQSATAMGYNTTASGLYSTAMGAGTIASGDYTTSMGGQGTEASGNYSMAMGYNSKASGYASVAMGYITTTLASNSVAMGMGTTARSLGSVSVGRYNDDKDILNDPNPTARIFQVGNGIDGNSRSNALTILKSGYTGLGIVAPNAKLHISSANGSNSWAGYIKLEDALTTESGAIRYNPLRGMQFKISDGTKHFGFVNQNNTEIASIETNGTMNLSGDLYISGGQVTPSDIRLKEEIAPLTNVLSRVNTIQPITYFYKDKINYPTAHQIGFSAQEIQKNFPELVKTNKNGFLAVNYPQMTAVAIEAVKEQQEIIKNQEKRIDDLENRIQQLEKIIMADKK